MRTSTLFAFALLTLTAILVSVNPTNTRALAQAIPTSLPTTVVVTTTVPTTIPAHATTRPTTVPTTYPTTYATTVPTIVPGTIPPTTPPTAGPTPTPAPTPTPTSAPSGGLLYGCPDFPANDWIYGKRVDSVAADPNSAGLMNSYLSYVGQNVTLSLSYSSTYWFLVPATNATPQYPLVQLMPSGTPRPAATPTISNFPFTADMPWQGKNVAYTGDRHISVLNTATCVAHESYVSNVEPPATWIVTNNQLTQKSYYGATWYLTRAYPTAAPRTGVNLGGVPQFAGIVFWQDWQRGRIDHALNINIKSGGFGGSVYPCNSNLPLSNYKGTITPPIPCGVHWRLKSSYVLNCSPACPQAQMIVTALKQYGAFMMDQGTPPGTLYLANYQQPNGTWIVPWDANDVRNIQAIPMSALEVVPPPNCASVAACVKYAGKNSAPYGLNPGICRFIPQWWKEKHPLLYKRLCRYD